MAAMASARVKSEGLCSDVSEMNHSFSLPEPQAPQLEQEVDSTGAVWTQDQELSRVGTCEPPSSPSASEFACAVQMPATGTAKTALSSSSTEQHSSSMQCVPLCEPGKIEQESPRIDSTSKEQVAMKSSEDDVSVHDDAASSPSSRLAGLRTFSITLQGDGFGKQ